MKKQIISFFVFLLFAMNTNAQITLVNKDSKGNFPKITINNVRTKLFDRTSTGIRLYLYWDQVPVERREFKEYGKSV